MGSFFQDIRYGFRMLTKNPGFTLVVIMALALGIGVNTALFSVVYGILLKPLPYAQGKELVVLQQDFVKSHQPNIFFSVKEIDRKSTRLNSSHSQISYAVFCLKKKKNNLQAALLSRTRSTACFLSP